MVAWCNGGAYSYFGSYIWYYYGSNENFSCNSPFSSFHSVIPYIMNLISLIGVITILLGATLALDQKDI